MTWSLYLNNGDIVKGSGNSLTRIQGAQKVVQDLICWIREPFGTNPMHPDIGTFIYSGEEGAVIQYGQDTIFLADDYSEMVVSEIARVTRAYQDRQVARLREETQEYDGLHTFQPDELLKSFNVYTNQLYDTLYVTIELFMYNGEGIQLDIPVMSSSTELETG